MSMTWRKYRNFALVIPLTIPALVGRLLVFCCCCCICLEKRSEFFSSSPMNVTTKEQSLNVAGLAGCRKGTIGGFILHVNLCCSRWKVWHAETDYEAGEYGRRWALHPIRPRLNFKTPVKAVPLDSYHRDNEGSSIVGTVLLPTSCRTTERRGIR